MSFPRLRRLEEEALQLELATALSLSETHERQTVVEDLSDEEDVSWGLAQSHEDDEEEVKVALAVSKTLQEEEDFNKALAVSQALYQEERQVQQVEDFVQFRPISQIGRQQEEPSMIELQEQLLEWSRYIDEDTDCHILHSNQIVDEEPLLLPAVYRNYRLVPTLFLDSEMWPPGAVGQQLRELRVDRGKEEIREWQETQCESDRCLVCFTNVATRVAVPCGHKLCCRLCVSALTDKPNYYSVTSSDGDILTTDRQLPVQCFTCRSIVGQILTLH